MPYFPLYLDDLGYVGWQIGAIVGLPPMLRWTSALCWGPVVPVLPLLAALPLAPALARLPREQAAPAGRSPAPWTLLTPPLRAFLATAFLLQVSSGAWTGFYAVHTASLGFSDTVPGLTWGLAVIAEIALFFWGARLVERVAPSQLIVVVLVLTAVRWALTAAAQSEAVVVALQTGHAITFSAFHLASVLLLSRLVPAESRTGGQALYGGIAFGLGGATGLALAGALLGRVRTSPRVALQEVIAASAPLPARPPPA